MKLRHPWFTKLCALAGSLGLRGWVGTLRFQYASLGPESHPYRLPSDRRHLYAFWHETLLLPTYAFRNIDCAVLIGRHADGELIADVARRFGFRAVRGSSTRGGVEAVRRLLHAEPHGHLAVTPDGPRGPRRVVQPGVAYLASRLGLPVVPTGFGFDRPWRCSSWDRFVIPRPFSRTCCVTAVPVTVPADADRHDLEAYRGRIEDTLHHVSALAERWAEQGIPPEAADAPVAIEISPLRRSA